MLIWLSVVLVLYASAAWFLFRIACKLHSRRAWMAWVPILDLYLTYRLARLRGWLIGWCPLLVVLCPSLLLVLTLYTGRLPSQVEDPIGWTLLVSSGVAVVLNWVMAGVALGRIARRLGRPGWWGFLTVVPVSLFVTLGLLAFGRTAAVAVPVAEKRPVREPTLRPALRRAIHLLTTPKGLVASGFVLLAIVLLSLTGYRGSRSVSVTGWGTDARLAVSYRSAVLKDLARDAFGGFSDLSEVGFNLRARGGWLYLKTYRAELWRDSLVVMRAGKPDTVVVTDSLPSDSTPSKLTVHGSSWMYASVGLSRPLLAGDSLTLRPPPAGFTISYQTLPGSEGADGRLSLVGFSFDDRDGAGVSAVYRGRERLVEKCSTHFETYEPIALSCAHGDNISFRFWDSTCFQSGSEDAAVVYRRDREPRTRVEAAIPCYAMSLALGCVPHDTVEVVHIPVCMAWLYLDSGAAAVGSHLRPTPSRFDMPTTLLVSGDFLLDVKRIGHELRFGLSGLASSMCYAGGHFEDPKMIRKYGVELVPSALESSRDTFVAIAAILVFFTQLVMFLFNLFKKEKQ